MLEEMQIIFDLDGRIIEEEIIRKVDRLKQRLEGTKGVNDGTR